MRRSILALLAIAAAALVPFGNAAGARWVVSWAASPVNPSAAFGPFPATPTFHNQTLRTSIRETISMAATKAIG